MFLYPSTCHKKLSLGEKLEYDDEEHNSSGLSLIHFVLDSYSIKRL